MKSKLLVALLALAVPVAAVVAGEPAFDDAIASLGHEWAKANYQTPDGGKDAAFGAVIAHATRVAKAYPGKAEPLVWEAIALSGAAKVEGGFSALHKARQARDLLLQAKAIDPTVINGAVYTSLGSLYANVPGWPLGFGDKDKARTYLQKALALAPKDIDANYFYADFLADRGDYAQAARYLEKALAAPPRQGRADADAGRREDANALLAMLKRKHGDQLANK